MTQIKVHLKLLSKLHQEMFEKIAADIVSKSLAADKLISELNGISEILDVNDTIVSKAKLRIELANPPGKRGSLGDSIHWETLMKSKYHHVDIVSSDTDFSSPLNPEEISDALAHEWKAKKFGGQITLYKDLSKYFRQKYPQVKMSREVEKDELILRLQNSKNFSETHTVVESLAKFKSFTRAQIRNIFASLVENTQVWWIATDSDVCDFYLSFENDAWFLDETTLREACQKLEVHEGYFDIPF